MNLDTESLAMLIDQALERTAFLFAEPLEPGSAVDTSGHARLRYEGQRTGQLDIHADDGFLEELAQGMLGDDDSDDMLEMGRVALCELCNIVAGSVVQKLGGCNEEIKMGIPELVAPDMDTASSTGEVTRCTLESEEGRVEVIWRNESAIIDREGAS